MKNPGEASVISRSQSETSSSNVQSKLLNGSNKFDNLFSLFDQICLSTHFPLFLYYIESIYLYYQVFFSSFYLFNNYWFLNYDYANDTLISILKNLEKIAWFFNIEYENDDETNLLVAFVVILIIFVISTIIILYEIFGTTKNHKIRKVIFYMIRFIVDIISPIMIIPLSAIVGTSIRNLVLTNSMANVAYLIIGAIVYACLIFYTYVGFTILNSSICISKTLFSSNNIMIPLFLPTINSVFVLIQGIISVFEGWAMIIVQISHVVIGLFLFHDIYYLLFHVKSANAMFISVILSTWVNDVIFTILYFIPESKFSSNGVNFLNMAGFIIPLTALIICIVLSSLFVYFKSKKIMDKLTQLSEIDIEGIPKEDFQSHEVPVVGMELFKNEGMTMMSFHLSFLNASPIFYNSTYLNYFASLMPTTPVLLSIVQYLSYFPGETRELNTYLQIISKKNSLNYHQRFLIYQIIRFKMLRQSSVSSEANRLFAELKSNSQQCCENILSFYDSINANVSFLEKISDENIAVNMKWDETIHQYPNNQKLSDEYCTYLIECQMDLQKALVMRYRANFIELGKNFTVDIPFKRFASCFPVYFKKRIVDYQGTFRRSNDHTSKKMKKSHSQTSTSSAGNSNSSGPSGFSSNNFSVAELDPDLQDEIGSQLFKKKNLRLEMYRALNDRKSYVSLLILIAAYVCLIIGVVFFVVVYKYSTNYIDYRINSCNFINLASKTISYLDLSILGSTLKFAYFTDRFTTLSNFTELGTDDDNYNYQTNMAEYIRNMFHVDDDISNSIIHMNRISSMNYFHELLTSLNDYANDNSENIYEFGYLLMTNEVPYISCFDGAPLNEVNTSIKSLESYMFLVIEQSASRDVDENSWYRSNEICEIMSNQPGFHRNMLLLFKSLMEHEIKKSKDENKTLLIWEIVFPIVIFLVDFVPIMIFMYLFYKDVNKMIHILLSVNVQSKEEAKNAIRKDNTIEFNQITDTKLSNKKWTGFVVILFILSAVTAIIIFFILSETDKLNTEIEKMVQWDYFSSARLATVIETMNYILNAIILNGTSALNVSSSNTIANQEKMIELTREGIKTLEKSNDGLLKGTENSEACYDFDDELDSINYMTVCDLTDDENLHDSYRCCSASTSLSIFITMIDTIITDIGNINGNFDHEMIPHTLHLLNRHIFSRLERFNDRLSELNSSRCQDLVRITTIIFIVGLVITVFLFATIFYMYHKTVKIYHVGMVLTQRLPLHEFISDKKLLNFVLNRKEKQDDQIMSTAQSAIFMSLDPIVCTNVTGVVEIINPAVTQTLGYTPDQMLGQHISSIFSNFKDGISANATSTTISMNDKNNDKNTKEDKKQYGDADKVANQLELMLHGQSQLVFEDHFVCMTDDAREMPCGVTILGMTSENNGDDDNASNKNVRIESFVVILRDETQLIQQQKAAEAAKAQSENLLYHILPQDIVSRINSGEKDISFTVQSASIIFTDVVKFHEYAATLSPPEVMRGLSTLFEAFDAVAQKYSLITKIKLIGDIYMAAAGLFSDDISPKNHAEDILKFGLDCLTELDDVNMKLSANLQLRVGINSGGPILAGVLGTDKPVFDIIGDPINVAARLQTTDIPGKVQIPQSTFELIQDCGFSIEERGEVFLKGKGKTMTYLVSPSITEASQQFSESEKQ